MAVKKTTKKTTKKATKKTADKASVPTSSDRSVRIERAVNGFTVSSWMKDKEVRYIAKTKPEAMAYAEKMFAKF